MEKKGQNRKKRGDERGVEEEREDSSKDRGGRKGPGYIGKAKKRTELKEEGKGERGGKKRTEQKKDE